MAIQGATFLSALTGFGSGILGAFVVRGVEKATSSPASPQLPAKVSGDDLGGLVVREIVRQTNNLGGPPLDGQVLVQRLSPQQKAAALRAAQAGASPAQVFQAAGINVRQLEDSRLPPPPPAPLVVPGRGLLVAGREGGWIPGAPPAVLLKKDCGCASCKHGTDHGHGAEPCAGCAAPAAAAPSGAPALVAARPAAPAAPKPASAPAAPAAEPADEDAEELDTVSGEEELGAAGGRGSIEELPPFMALLWGKQGKITTLNGAAVEEEGDDLGAFAIPIKIVAGALPAGVSGDDLDDLGWATWTTRTRPNPAREGDTGFNADLSRMETWSGGRWALTDGDLGAWSLPVKVGKWGIPVRQQEGGGWALPVAVGERGIPVKLVEGGAAKVSGDVGGFITNLQDKAVRMGILSFCRGALKDAEAADRAPATPDTTSGIGDDVFRALAAGGGAVTDVFVPGAGTALRTAATKIKRKVDRDTGHIDRGDRGERQERRARGEDEVITLNGGGATMSDEEILDGDDLGDAGDDLGLVYKGVHVGYPKFKRMKAGKSYRVNSEMLAIDKSTFKDWRTRFAIHPIQELAKVKKRLKLVTRLFKKNTAKMKRSIAKNLPYMQENAALKQQLALLGQQPGAGMMPGMATALDAGGGFEDGGMDAGDAAFFSPDMVSPGPEFGDDGGMFADADADGTGEDMLEGDDLDGDDDLGDDDLGDDLDGDDDLGDDDLGDDLDGDDDLGDDELGAVDPGARRLIATTRAGLQTIRAKGALAVAQRNRTRSELRRARQRLGKCRRIIAQLKAQRRAPPAALVMRALKYRQMVGALTTALRQGIQVLKMENRRIAMNRRGQSADGLSGAKEGDIASSTRSNLAGLSLNTGAKKPGAAPPGKSYPRAHHAPRFFRQQVPVYVSPFQDAEPGEDLGPLAEDAQNADDATIEGLGGADNLGCGTCQNIATRGQYVADLVPDYSRANDGTG